MKYEVKGEPLPVLICNVDAEEKMITERGSMVWMSPNMEMKTSAGGVGKAFGRMFTGEAMFQNIYTAKNAPGMIAFASSFPGSIKPIEVRPDKPVICQKMAFLASTEGVNLSVKFQKKIRSAFFGGEGFIMQKLSGTGTAFVEIDGTAVEYDLKAGEQLLCDTGCLAVCDDTVDIDIKSVGGLKNMMFGGEGIFNTVLTGPGKVILQSMPMAQVASSSSSSSDD